MPNKHNTEDYEDDDEVRQYYIEAWIGDRYDPERLALEKVYAKRAVFAEWLNEAGYNANEILLFDTQGVLPEDRDFNDENAIFVGLRLWIEWVTGEDVPIRLIRWMLCVN